MFIFFIMNLVYSCVFLNETNVTKLEYLLKSYVLYGEGKTNSDTKYLVITSTSLKNMVEELFKKLHVNGEIWCLNLYTAIQSSYSKYYIFDYPGVKKYEKILYLDLNVVVTNDIKKIFNYELEDKIYSLEEGNTRDECVNCLFEELSLPNPNISRFLTEIMLFPNSKPIQQLFKSCIKNIKQDVYNSVEFVKKYLDKPYITHYAIKENLHNTTLLKDDIVLDPSSVEPPKLNLETLSYLTTGNLAGYQNHLLHHSTAHFLNNKSYYFEGGRITFLEKNKIEIYGGHGMYYFKNNHTVQAFFSGHNYTLKFNNDYGNFVSIRNEGGLIAEGHVCG